MNKELNEPILPDDYPVYAGYFYVVDGLAIESDITGTIAKLKQHLQVTEIRRCDAICRGLLR